MACSARRSNSAAGRSPVINRWASSQAGVPGTPYLPAVVSASTTAAVALPSAGQHAREVNTRLSRVLVNHGGILEVLAENKVRFKKLSLYGGKIVRLMPPCPLGSSQGRDPGPACAASAASGFGAKHMVRKKRIGRGLYAGTDRARRCRSRAARRARNAGGAVETDNRRFVVAASRPRRRRSEQRRRVANTSMDANQSYRLSQAGYPAVTTTLMLIGSGFDGW
jgi:hypothetical protein